MSAARHTDRIYEIYVKNEYHLEREKYGENKIHSCLIITNIMINGTIMFVYIPINYACLYNIFC